MKCARRIAVATEYRIVYKLEELPLAVQLELKPFPMADADGVYQVGCVTSGPEPKPLSRLIFGAISTAGRENQAEQIDCYVHYESGGFAHTYSARHYSMASLAANKATLVESTYVPERCANVEELKALLASLR